jgi:RNA polymerase sigma factor (sigma-70 family)
VTTLVRLAARPSGTPAPSELVGLAGPSLLARESDERLAALVRGGDHNAFAAIVARYAVPLERQCRRILPASRAEDALQQTFANAYVALAGGATPDALRPWLFRIAHNISVNCLRDRESDSLDVAGELRDPQQQPHEIVVRRESLRSVIGALAGLPSQQRHVIVRQEFDGHSHEQIAGELGVSMGAVRQLAHRARRTVRAAAAALIPAPLWQRTSWLFDLSDGGQQVIAGSAVTAVIGKTAVVILMATAAGGAYEVTAAPHAQAAPPTASSAAQHARPARGASASSAAAASRSAAPAAARARARGTVKHRTDGGAAATHGSGHAGVAAIPAVGGSHDAAAQPDQAATTYSAHDGAGAQPVAVADVGHATGTSGSGPAGATATAAAVAAEPAEVDDVAEIEDEPAEVPDAVDQPDDSDARSVSDDSGSSAPAAVAAVASD